MLFTEVKFSFICANPPKNFLLKTQQRVFVIPVEWNIDLRKPDLRKNLDLRKIVLTTDFLVHKLFDLGKIF